MQRMLSLICALVNQSMTDKVLDDVSYPFTVFEKSWPFDGKIASMPVEKGSEEDLTTITLSADESEKVIAWGGSETAQKDINSIKDKASQKLIQELSRDIAVSKAEFLGELDRLDAARDQIDDWKKQGKKHDFVGPSLAELADFRKLKFPVKFHLAHMRVRIPSRPTVNLGGETTQIKNLGVHVSATAEMWVHVPVFQVHQAVLRVRSVRVLQSRGSLGMA